MLLIIYAEPSHDNDHDSGGGGGRNHPPSVK